MIKLARLSNQSSLSSFMKDTDHFELLVSNPSSVVKDFLQNCFTQNKSCQQVKFLDWEHSTTRKVWIQDLITGDVTEENLNKSSNKLLPGKIHLTREVREVNV